jgi:hypothetical protein
MKRTLGRGRGRGRGVRQSLQSNGCENWGLDPLTPATVPAVTPLYPSPHKGRTVPVVKRPDREADRLLLCSAGVNLCDVQTAGQWLGTGSVADRRIWKESAAA